MNSIVQVLVKVLVKLEFSDTKCFQEEVDLCIVIVVTSKNNFISISCCNLVSSSVSEKKTASY